MRCSVRCYNTIAPTVAGDTGRRQFTSRTLPATEIVQRYLDRAHKLNGELGSFITIDNDGALAQAKSIDERLQRGEEVGFLAGMPVAVKDNICTQGVETTAGSQILKGYVPPYDAAAVARLRAAGAVIIGKTNMDEFGMGSSTENSGFRPTANPWNTSRVPGGSSGGSAAAVAAGQSMAALGSDTGGSIRQPAHFCGVVGLKPTYGRVSRSGLISYASSLDVIGPMASSVMDAAALLTAIAGPDPSDATCSPRPSEDFTARLLPSHQFSKQPLAGKKIALIKETTGEGVDDDVETAIRCAVEHLAALGAQLEEVSLPSFALGLPAYYVIAVSEASSNLSRYDGVRYGVRADSEDLQSMYRLSRAALGEEVRRRILMGTYALSAGYYDAYYRRAQQVRTLVTRDASKALEQYDALLCPAAPTVAYKLGEKTSDPLSMYKGDLMTVNVNLAGLPAVTLPCGFGMEGMPIGLQLVGKAWGEANLLQLAHVYEQTAGVAEKMSPPELFI